MTNKRQDITRLTARQAQALRLLANDYNHAQAAEIMGISRGTFKNMVYNAKLRTGYHTTTGLVAAYIREN